MLKYTPTVFLILALINSRVVFAQSYDNAKLSPAFGATLGILIILFSLAIALFFIAIWIWLLIDVIKRPMDSTHKALWILGMIFLGWFVSLAYFIAIKKGKIKDSNSSTVLEVNYVQENPATIDPSPTVSEPNQQTPQA